LLALTTPVGTGAGVHQNQALHPVFAHAHLIDGRIVSDERLAAAQAAAGRAALDGPPRGPALGAGSGGDAAGYGLGLVPVLPMMSIVLAAAADGRLSGLDETRPLEFRDCPEDPPPNLLA
jgi:hypothetical protein